MEKTKQFDIGLDMAFFNNLRGRRLLRQKSEDLPSRLAADTSGYGSAMQNVSSIRFYGLEFEISSVNVSTKNFSWTTDFTYSFNAKVRVARRVLLSGYRRQDAWRIGGYTMNGPPLRQHGGEPLGRIYGYKTPYHRIEAQADAALYDSNRTATAVRTAVDRRTQGRATTGGKPRGAALTADGREQINGEDMFSGQCRAP
ncbi:MAG: hypothetical protein ACLRMJ_09950 [Alistipes finegoldii]